MLDAFTKKLLPSFRKGFEDLNAEIRGGLSGGSCAVDERMMDRASQPRDGIF